MPSLSAQVPQFDNADFEGGQFPAFCDRGWFPNMEACGVTGVDWWMWKEFEYSNTTPPSGSVDVGAGLFNNPQGCNNGNALFFVETVGSNNATPLFATRNPTYNLSNFPARIKLSLQQRPELATPGTFAKRLKVFGTNQKNNLEPNATAVEVGISKILTSSADCENLEIWLDASAKNFEYLGFALSDGVSSNFQSPAYIDHVKIRKQFDYEFSVNCDGMCIQLAPYGVLDLSTPLDWTFEFYLNDNLVYEYPAGAPLNQKVCLPYAGNTPAYNSGANEFKIVFSSNNQDYVAIVKENFEYSPIMNVVIPSGNTTWSLSNVPNSGRLNSLTLLSGATLTIDSDVKLVFQQNGELDINLGARLNNKGTLSSCSDFWQGVRVVGAESNPGRFLGYPESVIENAKIGIMNSRSNTADRGGDIRTYKAIFKNNEVAVQMHGDGNSSEVPSATPDNSFFKYSTFIIDKEMSPSLTFKSFVELYFMNMSKVSALSANHFIVDESVAQPPVPNFGVLSFVSSFQARGNDFKRLQNGVSAYGFPSFGAQAYVAVHNDFHDCLVGIHNRAITGSYMKYNDFYLGSLPSVYQEAREPQIGIAMENSIADFYLQENHFMTKMGNEELTYGIQCTNMGANHYDIRDNTFDGLNSGNRAHLKNGYLDYFGLHKGLDYSCNINTGNGFADFYVTDNPASIIDPVQRYNNGLPTNNIFSQSTGIEWDFGNLQNYPNSADFDIDYFYDPNYSPLSEPRVGFIRAVAVIDVAGENHCKVKTGGPFEPGKDGLRPEQIKVDENRMKYFQQHKLSETEYLAMKDALSQGNAELAKSNGKLAQKYQQVAGQSAFYGYLYALLDTTGNSADSIPLWLGRMNRFEADIALAGRYRQQGLVQKTTALLDELSSKFELKGDDFDDLELYRKMMEVLDGKDLMRLDNASLYQFGEAAKMQSGLTSAFAKNVMTLYGAYFSPISTDNIYTTVPVPEGEVVNKLRLTVSPNPTSAYATLDWSVFKLGNAEVEIELRDKTGNLLEIVKATESLDSKEISLESYSDGMIFYYLKSNGQLLDSGQIILNR